LQKKPLAEEMYVYLHKLIRNFKCILLSIVGIEDQIHILGLAPKEMSMVEIMTIF